MYSNFTLGNPKSHFQRYLYMIIDVVSEMGISAVNRVIKNKKGGRFLEHSLYQADIRGLPVHQSVRRCMDHHHIRGIRALLGHMFI